MKKYKKRVKAKRNWYVPVAIIAVILVLGIQLISLYSKISVLNDRQEVLEKELSDAKTTQEELVEYEEYTNSDDYVKNTARSKLGLVGENEIIFKEK